MTDYKHLLDRYVEARGGDGSHVATGRVVAYAGRPTVTIETSDGELLHWMAHLVRPTNQKALTVEELAERHGVTVEQYLGYEPADNGQHAEMVDLMHEMLGTLKRIEGHLAPKQVRVAVRR